MIFYSWPSKKCVIFKLTGSLLDSYSSTHSSLASPRGMPSLLFYLIFIYFTFLLFKLKYFLVQLKLAMLYLSTRLNNLPLLSIRSSGRIGTVLEPIINPHNLHIDGFYCRSAHSKDQLVLLDMHIRDLSAKGIIIDDHNDLSKSEDLVRLQPVMDLKFKLVDKLVLNGKKRIGKVAEYAINIDSLFIQKLYVQAPVWQSINQNRLVFDRTSVLEVTDSHIVVSGPEEKVNSVDKTVLPRFSANYSASTSLINE